MIGRKRRQVANPRAGSQTGNGSGTDDNPLGGSDSTKLVLPTEWVTDAAAVVAVKGQQTCLVAANLAELNQPVSLVRYY